MSLGSHLVWAPAAEKIATPDVSLAMGRMFGETIDFEVK
jgi:hypothetical protein